MEYRTFRLQGQQENVIFCHLVGERSMSYGTRTVPPWHAPLSDLFKRGIRQRDEQIFLRISSNRPLEEFRNTPPVQIFLARLASAAPAMVQ
jgi:hypothetical protein